MFDGFKVTRVFGDDWDRLNDMKNVFMRWRMVVNHLLYSVQRVGLHESQLILLYKKTKPNVEISMSPFRSPFFNEFVL